MIFHRRETIWPTGSVKRPRIGFQLSRICDDSIMEIQPDFKDLLELFNSHKVKYLIKEYKVEGH